MARADQTIEHPLTGAAVGLRGQPRFEGRNGLLGIPGTEVIHPLELVLGGDGVKLCRRDWLDAADGDLLEVAPDALARRGGGGIERGDAVAAAISAATGIDDFLAHRRDRAARIERARHAAAADGDAVREAALRRRGEALASIMRMRVSYALDLGAWGGSAVLEGRLPGRPIDLQAGWPLRFWMGAWDADALCGFVAGTLTLPERRAAPGK